MKQKHLIIGGVALVALLLLSNTASASSGTSLEDDDMEPNLRAFLLMLQWCEGTWREPNPYAVCYGYSHVIQDFSDHPAFTGEWNGVLLPDNYCYGAGINPPCKSYAAGAYQMNKIAWREIKDDLGEIGFEPSAQDYACIHKLDKMGALGFAIEGDLSTAIQKSNKYWASLPGAPFGQPTRTYAQCEAFFVSQGGNVSGARAAVSGGVNFGRLGAARNYVQL